ncbi:enoyl-CoA hydratase [Erythrobacter sp. Dej080120_24]|uniref:enoyl-CoA hydratase family protein n=1 Tax=Erythrobacter TaxID=1041 RepID=UPI0004D40114|nr:enoyl-CoA hydratase family protein [Erythrobacter aurantius]KEO86216.1 enoyl-CoA hydratase [Erythrobacter sp. JL475]BDW83433.1 enoyl-CoA hydratase [Erythrobacter sp. Dej080120_24]
MGIETHIKDRIAEIVFDVPPVNAFDSETWMSIPDIVTAAARNPEVNCVLIRAEGKGFCGGVDIKEMQAHPERITVLNRGNYLTFKAIRDAEIPVVVAAHKFVIGGGIGICGAADTIIAADDAYFSLPEVDRGAMGGASHLSRMLPLHKVRAAFFTGGNIPAAEAHRLGAVEKVVPRADLEAEARAFCAVIASKSRKALVIAKEALNGLEARDVDRGYRWEQGFTLEMYMHEDSQKSRDEFVKTGKAAEF